MKFQEGVANSEEFENNIFIRSSGFREYDARWLYPQEINLRGVQQLGMGLGSLLQIEGRSPSIVVGHDYRSYSAAIKYALITGLMATGCHVYDIGLALSPAAYFAQFALDCPAVAMVTASHNENGWTGVKMGRERPLTFGPEEMTLLKDTVLSGDIAPKDGGSYSYVTDIKERYIKDLVKDGVLKRRLKAVVACGNGTAGAYAPAALRALGCEVIELDCDLDYTFPHYNPNPEDMGMLKALSEKVLESGADAGFAFDGDGDRCGVVDNTGREIFADKVGVMLARDLSALFLKPQFIADIKSTGLYQSDPVLAKRKAFTEYWKTGHSYIKRRVSDTGALAGFEKSGHFFFNAPFGRGYDDGLLSAVMICRMLDRNPDKTLGGLYDKLPTTWGSPTMSPYCPDEKKYSIVDEISHIYHLKKERGEKVLGVGIAEISTINGVRVTLADGTWGLVRASSNKPSLVVVVESPVSQERMTAMFEELHGVLKRFPAVGDYDQSLLAA